MSIMVIFSNKENPNRWRPFEKEKLQEYFGDIHELDFRDNWEEKLKETQAKYIYWKIHAERSFDPFLHNAIGFSGAYSNIKQINPPIGWACIHAKDICFEQWLHNGINIPKYFTFNSFDEFLYKINFLNYLPLLIRLNNGNTGEASDFIYCGDHLKGAVERSLGIYREQISKKYGISSLLKSLCVDFIDHTKYGYRYSYRIIVAGDRVVTGYARLSPPDQWIAITDRFKPEMGEAFIKLNQECEKFCFIYKENLIKAVKVLNCNFVGLDVIFDNDGKPYFLEVQNDFSCGNPRYGDKPPWYNPSYPELVKFIKDKEDRIKKECPMYYYNWLNKEKLFDLSFKTLKEGLNKE